MVPPGLNLERDCVFKETQSRSKSLLRRAITEKWRPLYRIALWGPNCAFLLDPPAYGRYDSAVNGLVSVLAAAFTNCSANTP